MEFTSQIENWTEKTVQFQEMILQDSLRALSKEAFQNTPVITGNTRNSIELSGLARIEIAWRMKKFKDPTDAINNAAAGIVVGQTAWVGFRAPWAHKLEPKYAMLRLTAQRWIAIVDGVASKLKG